MTASYLSSPPTCSNKDTGTILKALSYTYSDKSSFGGALKIISVNERHCGKKVGKKLLSALKSSEFHLELGVVLCAQSLQSCRTLCDPLDCSPPGSSVHGILQARTLEWVAISFSRGIFLTQGLNP